MYYIAPRTLTYIMITPHTYIPSHNIIHRRLRPSDVLGRSCDRLISYNSSTPPLPTTHSQHFHSRANHIAHNQYSNLQDRPASYVLTTSHRDINKSINIRKERMCDQRALSINNQQEHKTKHNHACEWTSSRPSMACSSMACVALGRESFTDCVHHCESKFNLPITRDLNL